MQTQSPPPDACSPRDAASATPASAIPASPTPSPASAPPQRDGTAEAARASAPSLTAEAKMQLKQRRRADARVLEARRIAALSEPGLVAFHALSRLRSGLARSTAVPPYCILTNAHVLSICAVPKMTLADLAALPGIRRLTVETWGAEILATVTKAWTSAGMESLPHPASLPSAGPAPVAANPL